MPTSIDFKSISSVLWVVCTLAMLVGCSGGNSNLTAVSGVVKANGEPVTEGEIMFYPTGGRPAIAQIGPDGRYELTSFKKGDGVPPGTHKVTISAYTTTGSKGSSSAPTNINEETMNDYAQEKIIWLIPEKYSERRTSTLTAEVEAGKANEINFDSADFE